MSKVHEFYPDGCESTYIIDRRLQRQAEMVVCMANRALGEQGCAKRLHLRYEEEKMKEHEVGIALSLIPVDSQ